MEVSAAFVSAVVLGLCIHVASGTTQTNTYENCSASYTNLEIAYRGTGQNLDRTWATFYPPRDPMPLYVKVTYTFLDERGMAGNEEVEDEHYIWTAGSIYLMQPPAVFGLTSLFLGPAGEDRVQELTLFLPHECRGLKDVTKDSNSNYLELLTERLKLYAQFPDGHLQITDDYFAKAIRNPSHDLKTEYRYRNPFIYIFGVTFVGLPLLLLICIFLFVKGARWQIRKRLLHAQPAVYASLASVIITGLFFSLYVVGIDAAAVYYATTESQFSANKEKYEYIWSPLLVITWVTLGIDLIFTLVGFLMAALASSECGSSTFKCCCCFVFCCKGFGEDHKQQDKEKRLWLLSGALVAPIGCIGTHFSYINLAWLSFPVGAGGVFLTYIITFVANFFIFRQLYLALIDRACCCFSGKDSALGCPVKDKRVSKQNVNTMGFNYCALWIEFLIGIGIAVVEIWYFVGLVFLPINDLAEYAGYLYSFTTTIIVVIGGLISYKLLHPHPKTAFHEKAFETFAYLRSKQTGAIPTLLSSTGPPPGTAPHTESTHSLPPSAPPSPRTTPHTGVRDGSLSSTDPLLGSTPNTGGTHRSQPTSPMYSSNTEKMAALWGIFLYKQQHEIQENELKELYKKIFGTSQPSGDTQSPPPPRIYHSMGGTRQ